jgi:hypothetical protein
MKLATGVNTINLFIFVTNEMHNKLDGLSVEDILSLV